MRPVYCALLILLPVCAAYPRVGVTVVLQFEDQYSELSIGEMKTEAQALVKDSGVVLSWRRMDQLSSSAAFPRMVVVRFRGVCQMGLPVPPLPLEAVTLGSTYILGGEPSPFSDIECDRIRSSLGAQPGRGDLLFGRALGRVLAHELHHVIDRTRRHTATSYMRQSLSVADLIAKRR
jgi:hypothetical protein